MGGSNALNTCGGGQVGVAKGRTLRDRSIRIRHSPPSGIADWENT